MADFTGRRFFLASRCLGDVISGGRPSIRGPSVDPLTLAHIQTSVSTTARSRIDTATSGDDAVLGQR
jgi:hypothetical protein